MLKQIKNSNFTLQTKDDLVIIGRANSLKRCFLNIIQNGLVYGEKVHAYVEKTANRVVIVFEDDGWVFRKINTKMFLNRFID